MDTNAVGPLKMAEAFIDHVSVSVQKKIMNVSSAGGSLSTARGGGRYFYRASKTALNGFMRNLAVDVEDRGIIIGLLSPGRVLNDAMREAIRKANITLETIEPKVSIAGMIDVIDRFTPETSGAFIGHRGDTIPW
jgi:NAD(P)-dependent dehydrogenase (short-subunit alcohol dehydrogenase family)